MGYMQGYMKYRLRMECIATIQRIYHHERFVAHSYRELAKHSTDDSQRCLLLDLANIADRRSYHYRVRIRSLGASLPQYTPTCFESFWYWVLMHYGVGNVLKWLESIQRDDISWLGSLLLEQKCWR